MVWFWVGVTAVFLVLELIGEVRDATWLVWLAKPIASTGFVLAGYAAGAFDSSYGQVIFVGLCFCWVGDVLLIPKKSKLSFLLGLVAFLTGHIAYAIAFTYLGLDGSVVGLTALALVVPVIFVGRWLLPNVSRRMLGPVVAYMTVITVMVTFAVGTQAPWVIGAAILFYLSDLAVARQRFIAPGSINRLVGLPLYFIAQVIFAVTV
ncbi:MAG: putative membrane protein YhhN [Myxococcota bacterium]|jgi:uncharacterized membrane protein YhhN